MKNQETIKLLIMGLQSAGKTTLIKHIFEGKDWPELKNIEMTEFVDTFNYKYRGYLDITIFDAGGQKQFLESYFNEIWGSKIFSSVKIFFWVLDSSTPENFNKAKSKLKDCLEYLNKNSNNVLKYLILSK
ncbi:MAG: ADP-ribosylation factor-like protein [Candidatus Helarchaeota archaeon]